MNRVNVSLAAFGGRGYIEAMVCAQQGVSEPLLGPLSLEHTQLCPQNRGQLTTDLAGELVEGFPATRFRLHANVQVLPSRQITDLAQFDAQGAYWQAMARVSKALDAPAYSAHAGQRQYATLPELLEHTRRASDLFGVPVAVEGHYPTPRGIFLVDSWEEYRTVFESGVPYALDLSHLNIVAVHSGRTELGLVAEMLAAPQCLEIHLSGNDGTSDQHRAPRRPPWWWPLLGHAHPDAIVFTEGKQSTH